MNEDKRIENALYWQIQDSIKDVSRKIDYTKPNDCNSILSEFHEWLIAPLKHQLIMFSRRKDLQDILRQKRETRLLLEKEPNPMLWNESQWKKRRKYGTAHDEWVYFEITPEHDSEDLFSEEEFENARFFENYDDYLFDQEMNSDD